MRGAVVGLDHVQLAMLAGKEDVARAFYEDLLGFAVQPKPESIATRGGLWLRSGACALHLGIDPGFRAATKAHPGLIVCGLDDLAMRLERAGYGVKHDAPIDGRRRLFTADPFGNRIELIEIEDSK